MKGAPFLKQIFSHNRTESAENGRKTLQNDFFQVYNTCPIENFELRIFDRWGNHIFQSTDPTAQWDGTYQGQALTPGVYVWQIRYESSNARGEVVSTVRTGDVTIMK